jgi:hypothetical protein
MIDKSAPLVYDAARRWIDAALETDESLFTPGTPIWSSRVIDDLYARFVEQPDPGPRRFEEKFRDQLRGAAPGTIQFAGELLYVHFLPAADISGAHKRKLIDTVLGWSVSPVSIPSDLSEVLDQGFASSGVAFRTRRPDQLRFLLEFARTWKTLAPDDRNRLLADPWAFKDFVFALPVHAAQTQRAALLHMVHPDTFETITSEDWKRRIAASLGNYVTTDSDDVDRRLLEIRKALTEEYGRSFEFWDEDVYPRWNRQEPQPEHPAAWIFQANPTLYDIDRALHELPAIEWTVRQHRNAVHQGDRAYIWRSGPFGGVVASGSVLSDPAETAPDRAEAPYYLDREAFAKVEPRVKIGIEERVDPPILRAALAADPVLRNVRILRFANATVFPLDSAQEERLIEMIAKGDGKKFWWVNQGLDYAREREHGYITAPLRDKGGGQPSHWRALTDVRFGDTIFHYARKSLLAVSEATAAPTSGPRPADVPDTGWGTEGHFVRVAYRDLERPISLDEIPHEWRREEGGPFTKDGAVQQGYLFPLSDAFVQRLVETFPELDLVQVEGGGAIDEEPDVGLPEIIEALGDQRIRIADEVVRRYHLSLNSKRAFVILAGVSGTGKTWLAEAYARAVRARTCLVPVAPNWTTNEDLLGYLNPLDQEYHHTEFSRFLTEAAEEWQRATRGGRRPRRYHLILDEMNLARVEYYFARFLSVMELRARAEEAAIELGPNLRVPLTPNLYFTGTVNVDETTHGFADKVYDRAQLIELPITRELVAEHLEGRPYAAVLLSIWDATHEVAPFAFRVLDEIGEYVDAAAEYETPWPQALDEQLLQKVLPKVKGTDLRLREALKAFVEVAEDRFPLSREKAQTMLATFNDHGFTSYF